MATTVSSTQSESRYTKRQTGSTTCASLPTEPTLHSFNIRHSWTIAETSQGWEHRARRKRFPLAGKAKTGSLGLLQERKSGSRQPARARICRFTLLLSTASNGEFLLSRALCAFSTFRPLARSSCADTKTCRESICFHRACRLETFLG